MKEVVWIAFGLTLGAAALHTTLGLRRPLDRTYLTFALLMTALAVFIYYEAALYRAVTPQEAIDSTRRQIIAVSVVISCFLVFVPLYTSVRLPAALVLGYWVLLVFMFVANLALPYSLWYSAPPRLQPSVFDGDPYTTVIVPPLGFMQYAWVILHTSLILIAAVCAFKMIRRGERQRGITLAISLAVVLAFNITDVIRDSVSGTWPYVAEYGLVTWGLVMSVQLAYDYRAQAAVLTRTIAQVQEQAAHLSSMLDALGALEHHMDAPLDTLETGIEKLADVDGGTNHVDPLRRAVTRLRAFRRSMPDVRSQ